MEKSTKPSSERRTRPAPSPTRSKFLFVNKNAGSAHLSRSEAPGEVLQIRRHVKRHADRSGQTRHSRLIHLTPSSLGAIAQEGYQQVARTRTQSPPSTAVTSDTSHRVTTKVASDNCQDSDDHCQEHGVLTEPRESLSRRRHGHQPRGIQPRADPARLVDPSSALPLHLDNLSLKVIRFDLSNTHNDSSEQFKSSLELATRRLQKLMHKWLLTAFTTKMNLACALASASVNIYLFHKFLRRPEALGYAQQAVRLMRTELAAQQRATSDLFFCMILLFNIESYLGNGEGAIVHVRAIWQVWHQIGGYDHIEASNVALFTSMVFFQHTIKWWDADPPIPPFWDPDEDDLPWPPRLMHQQDYGDLPQRTSSNAVDSQILSRKDVRRFIQPVLQYARDRLGVNDDDDDLGNFYWELRNFKMRQQIYCMRTDDARIHVLRRPLHMLASALTGYAWLTVYLAESARSLKADLVRMADHEWKCERHLRIFCLVVGAIHSCDSWFVRELAAIYAVWAPSAILQDLTAACGPFVQPNLVSTGALEALAKDIAATSVEKELKRQSPFGTKDPEHDSQRHELGQADLPGPDVPPYGVGRRYWETKSQAPGTQLEP